MLNKRLARGRALKLGASLLGACALAVGFASPAFATQTSGGNAPAANYTIVQGGSNTTYLMMQALSNTFNQAPGCDLASSSGTPQPLDYGCPGINDAGTTLSQDVTTTGTGNVTTTAVNGKVKVKTVSNISSLSAQELILSDTAGCIKPGTRIVALFPPAPSTPTGYKLLAADVTCASATDTITYASAEAVGENGFVPFGNENPFNDVLVEEPALGSSNGIAELEDQGSNITTTVAATSNGLDVTTCTSGVPCTVSVASAAAFPASGSFNVVTSTGAATMSYTSISGNVFGGVVDTANTPTGSATLATGAEVTEGHNINAVSHSAEIKVAPLDAARSSRAPATTDNKGLNFVAYAMDGVSWAHWTTVNGVATASTDSTSATTGCLEDSDGLANLPLTTLTAIYQGTDTTWQSAGCDTSAATAVPIAVYMAQNGSGTEATWAGALSLTGTFPFGGENSHHVIFENETASILANGDEANAIFFFSFGKFSQICTPNPSFCSGSTTSTFQLGDINNIKVDKATIATQLPGSTGSVFPVDRLLYNVYSNGSNPDIVPSSTAALNVVSEDGFLCKPSTSSDVDPNTGKTYLSEIDATITAQGFFPIPLSVEDGQGATTGLFASTGTGIPHPAWTTGALSTSNYNSANESFFPARDQDTDGTAVSGTYNGVLNGGTVQNGVVASSTAPVGYCITLTTDGNANN